MMTSSPALVLRAVLVLAALVGPAPRAHAAPDETAVARPWAANVSEEKQHAALGLYEDGNKLFEEGRHAEALARYREALGAWDHPAIRYNAAVALILLDQPLAAHENLELALRHGPAPFSPDTFQQAQTYRKLLGAQLTHLTISCAEAGAEVTLDGRVLFVGPGSAKQWILPGAHQLVARKAGFLPDTRSVSLVAGRATREQLSLHEIRSLPAKTERRWAAWKPWAVLGTGALVALAGVPLRLAAEDNIADYNAGVASCRQQSGCPPEEAVSTAPVERAQVQNVAAISLFSVGGAVAAAGIGMVILNQPRVVPADAGARVSLVPLAGPGVVGLSVSLR
jgi:tetratricopeptide (TPR) repeat protein